MSYRKFRASQLFNGYEILGDQHVLITDEEGAVQSIIPLADAGEDISFSEGVLTPGFINCHCHLELSHLKGLIPEKNGMIDFIMGVMEQRHVTEETIHAAIESAENEMLKNGIVAVGDICNGVHTIKQKRLGRLHYHNFVEAIGFTPSIAGERFQKSLSVYNSFIKQSALSPVSHSIVPHASYSVSQELFKQIVDFPGNQILTMHNQESMEEDEWFRSGKSDFARFFDQMNIDISFFEPTGNSSLQSVFPFFTKKQGLILVHNVTTSAKDIRFLSGFRLVASDTRLPSPEITFCLCPNANHYIGNNLPNVELLMHSKFPITVGTDSLASNRQLSILEELKTLQENYPQIVLSQLLQWATLNGAKALDLGNLIGSFEKGKKPGIVLITGVERNILGKNTKVVRLL